ncbi:MAG: phosphoribosyl-AMP cyclohydrolase [Alphaproteobacteria bacterium]
MTEDITNAAAAIDEVLREIAFDPDGLVPAIAQEAESGEVLMMAWMNRDAVTRTLKTGQVHYYSRSRQRLWRKGETSGQTQKLVDFRVDCDGDTVLVLVEQTGVACHTGRHNCFFRAPRNGRLETIAEIEADPDKLYKR